MLVELSGKAGTLCSPARSGELRCPLMVRPTSEDVITGEIVQVLSAINPYWWLSDLMNTALGAPRFRRQHYRRLRIEPWRNRPCFPRELLHWDEGSTQVDVTISWENPPTTVLIEAKYGSPLSASVSNHDDGHGYPTDQLIRNIRVGLLECGYYDTGPDLFAREARELAVIVLSPEPGQTLVERYREPDHLRSGIPHPDRLVGLPPLPFVGHLGFRQLAKLLRARSPLLSPAERRMVHRLADYLEFKLARPNVAVSGHLTEGKHPGNESSPEPSGKMMAVG